MRFEEVQTEDVFFYILGFVTIWYLFTDVGININHFHWHSSE